MDIVVIVKRDPDLVETLDALLVAGAFPHRLHCWKYQSHQHTDDDDHHEKFEYGKARPVTTHCSSSLKQISHSADLIVVLLAIPGKSKQKRAEILGAARTDLVN
jgi:hypothetical protein